MHKDQDLKKISIEISRDVISKLAPKEKLDSVDITIEELLDDMEVIPEDPKIRRGFGFQIEYMVIAELLIPLVCSLVIDYLREYRRHNMPLGAAGIQEKVYNSCRKYGVDKKVCKQISKHMIDAFESRKDSLQ